ncbi:MAG: TauD/TfdA family dioxygenase [Rhizobiales bacterium]|nr:TauD/TfdA family dioxygenase [Hyphomicrobiales bacterium]
MSAFSTRPLLEGKQLPLLVQADDAAGTPLGDVVPMLRDTVDRHLPDCGALVFRGFSVNGPDAFRTFATDFGHPLLNYEFGSTPRSKVTAGVYTSTEYPAHQHILLHNEQAYTRDWPMKIWFYCMQPAQEGGETPIADSRVIYRDMPQPIRDRFVEKGVMYVRNYGKGIDVPWQQVFGTESKSDVEAYCARHGIDCEWKEDDELRTRQVCQGVACHPITGEWVWFNQAHLFHVSCLEPEVRESLLEIVEDEAELPRNALYGDGSPIDDDTLETVRSVLETHKIVFPWQVGDVAMLDNMLAAHGRAPFKGGRKVIVAMAEPNRTFE